MRFPSHLPRRDYSQASFFSFSGFRLIFNQGPTLRSPFAISRPELKCRSVGGLVVCSALSGRLVFERFVPFLGNNVTRACFRSFAQALETEKGLLCLSVSYDRKAHQRFERPQNESISHRGVAPNHTRKKEKERTISGFSPMKKMS